MQSTGVTTEDLEDLQTAWLAMRRGLPVRSGERSRPIRMSEVREAARARLSASRMRGVRT
jgi:hypothetical protein